MFLLLRQRTWGDTTSSFWRTPINGDGWLPLANFVVLCLTFLALVWYAWETLRLRRAAQEQVEGLQKPCIGLLTEARNFDDTVFKIGGAVGGMILADKGGNFVAHNLGSGLALNIRYRFTVLNPAEGGHNRGPAGYLPIIPTGGTFVMQVSRGYLRNFHVKAYFTYESLTGQHYESEITLNELVLTDFRFRRS